MIKVTVTEAAVEAGVGVQRVRLWSAKGTIKPVGKRGRAYLYDLDDVLKVERDTRAPSCSCSEDAQSCKLHGTAEVCLQAAMQRNDRLGLAMLEAGRVSVDTIRGEIWRPGGTRAEQPTKQGYGRVMTARYPTRWILAHRLVWIAEHGLIPPNLEVNHRNRRRWDNRIGNLELTTDVGQNRHWNGISYDAIGANADVSVERFQQLLAGAEPEHKPDHPQFVSRGWLFR